MLCFKTKPSTGVTPLLSAVFNASSESLVSSTCLGENISLLSGLLTPERRREHATPV